MELSVQAIVIVLDEEAAAVRLLGAAGILGVGVGVGAGGVGVTVGVRVGVKVGVAVAGSDVGVRVGVAVGGPADGRTVGGRDEVLAGPPSAGADDERRPVGREVVQGPVLVGELVRRERLRRLRAALVLDEQRAAFRAVVGSLRVLEAALGAVDEAQAGS